MNRQGMHIDDDDRFGRWHVVTFNPETPKHL